MSNFTLRTFDFSVDTNGRTNVAIGLDPNSSMYTLLPLYYSLDLDQEAVGIFHCGHLIYTGPLLGRRFAKVEIKILLSKAIILHACIAILVLLQLARYFKMESA